MKGLNEESIAQISDPEKLRYLLSGVVQKNTKQLRKLRILQRQLKNAKSELSNLSSTLTECKIECESNHFYKIDHEFEKIRADYNEFAFTSLFNIVQNLNNDSDEIDAIDPNIRDFLKQSETFRKEFKEKKNAQIEEFKSIISDRDKIIREKDQQIKELKEKIEKIETSPIPKEVEDLLSEKDQSIVKLRNLIQRYAKSDQIKQQQIDEQQVQIQQLVSTSTIPTSPIKQNNNNNNDTDLEQEVSELKTQLSQFSSKNLQEIEAKNEKLTAMLEKSNKLYTQLNEKYISLQHSIANHKNTNLSINHNLLFEIMTSPKNLHISNSLKKKSNKVLNNESTVIISLRKTLLQFFLTNEENQENLIPVILEIVGCNKEQIEGATTNYRRHQHLINKAGSFFGLFS